MAGGGPPKRLGEFDIVREVGRGGMGVVFEAVQSSLGRRVAIKVLAPAFSANEAALRRFQREARAAAKLSHPNIVQVHSIGAEWHTHYYVMEFVEGRALDEFVTDLVRAKGGDGVDPESASATKPDPVDSDARTMLNRPGEAIPTRVMSLALDALRSRSKAADSGEGGPHPPEQAEETGGAHGDSDGRSADLNRAYFEAVADMVAQAADGLAYAHHSTVIHRDIKPSNLMLADDGRVLITDFGLARDLSAEAQTMTGEFMGTPSYMSPEQIMASRVSIDARTDIYSLGSTLYELITLRPPFRCETRGKLLQLIVFKEPTRPRKLNRRIPKDLETIVLKAIEKDPDRRYQGAGAMSEDLRRFISGEDIDARRSSVFYRGCRRLRRHVWATAALALALVALGAASSRYWMERRRSAELTAEVWQERKQRLGRQRYEGRLRVAHSYAAEGAWRQAYEEAQKALAEPGRQNRVAAERLVEKLRTRKVLPAGFAAVPNAARDPATGLPLRIVCEADGAEMVLISGGVFSMGSDARADETPHEVRLDPLYMDVHEVTRKQYGFFEEARPDCRIYGVDRLWKNMNRLEHMLDFGIAPGWPAVAVPWSWARDYCVSVGKALPTEAEWEKAARGTDARPYPWGNATPDASHACLNRPWDAGPADVMSHPEGTSVYGCADMAGNVAEWCQDYYSRDYYAGSPPNSPLGPRRKDVRLAWRVLRGGGFSSQDDDLRCARRSKANPRDQATHIGFRGCLPARHLRFALAEFHPEEDVQWAPSLSEGLRLAAEADKPVLLFVRDSSAPWSRYVELNVLRCPDVVEASRAFVCTVVPSGGGEVLPALVADLRAPSVALLGPDGSVREVLFDGLCTVEGFAFDDPRELAETLRELAAP